jgi:protein-S-isoprenylcysteine O-methyltransferase Ste14
MTTNHASRKLAATGFSRLLSMPLLLGAVLFGAAGTFDYWEAWLYLAVLFVPMAALLIYLMKKAPDLLERRMRLKEQSSRQRWVIGLSILLFFVVYALPGLDRRYGWSAVSTPVVWLADLLVVLGYGLFALVLRENRYAARTVTVDQGQQVITTGPYALVRHPMYLAMSLLFIASPVGLGSWWAALPALALPVLLVPRIQNEEALPSKELPGYQEYMEKTSYRLIPGLW